MSCFLSKIREYSMSRRKSCAYVAQTQLFEPVITYIKWKINPSFLKRLTFSTFPCFDSIQMLVLYEVNMNYLQNKQKVQWPDILVDIKLSHFYNGKLYFFLTFQFFWLRNSTFFNIWFEPRWPWWCCFVVFFRWNLFFSDIGP